MKTNATNISDLSMLELFCMEVESQGEVLTKGLLALERSPEDVRDYESLMRAAHSLKGAARIVDRGPIVRIAHAMEDCFIACQKGVLSLSVDQIDSLLRGVDWIHKLAAMQDSELSAFETEGAAELDAFLDSLSGRIAPTYQSQAEPGDTTGSIENAFASPADPAVAGNLRSVSERSNAGTRSLRVAADTLTRLLGIAGELLIVSRSPKELANGLRLLKRQVTQINSSVDVLRHSVANSASHDAMQAAVLNAQKAAQSCRTLITKCVDDVDELDQRFGALASGMYREVLGSRMRPFADGVAAHPRMVRDMARNLGKQARLEIAGETTAVDRDILDRMEAPITHLLRNALDHGLEPPDERIACGKQVEGVVRLEANHASGVLVVTVADDGRGIDPELLRARIVAKGLTSAELASAMTENELFEFMFLPGFSMKDLVTEISGRGVGLDVVHSMAASVGGKVRVSSKFGVGTKFTLELPLTLSVVRALIADVSGEAYAFPLSRIVSVVNVPKAGVGTLDRHQYFTWEGEQVGLISAQQVFGGMATRMDTDACPVILLGDGDRHFGLVVDGFDGEQELVVLTLDPGLGKIKDISAGAILPDRSPALIVDVDDVIRSIEKLVLGGHVTEVGRSAAAAKEMRRKRALVVDDSLTVRELERKLLSGRGYLVDIAVDGMDGWNVVRSGQYDIVVTDVDMPRLDGIELVKLIKNDSKLRQLPVIIVSYKDRDEDRRRGLEAGADYYLTKASFHDETLLRAVVDLIGETES